MLIALSSVNLAFAASARTELTGETELYLEPDLGIVASYTNKISDSVGSSLKDSGQGFAGGFNLGWQTDYIHLLISYRGYIISSADFSGRYYMIHDYGFGIGYEWNIPFMTTVSLVGTRYDGDGVGGIESVSGGFGVRAAISYFFTDYFKINFNYSSLRYEFEQTATNRVKVGSQIAFISLSIPIDLSYPSSWWRLRYRAD